ncbi:synaptotagmin-15-like isoform X1 [Hydractinia symbiolongicarpus]|uniref:synaptotagmin-15-like isoform X1 n=1 Tax=Hydractinia symbiolongicarpus TaxID=13093 RepID=UPI00254E1505|nr:synaptotagmin-15-like isoform X1 [Hydractinia symbiolongicarpus]XP_057297972.1 synaptotagmin-15-like isoform X1 [Hydractinia symbiolongicarpus]XP_057297973.1 synaptotagmin-15-like isoform X1 [Hydractinia symbiolongicarpus]
MANLLQPGFDSPTRRGSYQPPCSPKDALMYREQQRRYSFPGKDDDKVDTKSKVDASPLGRFRKSIAQIEAVNAFFKVKPWTSDESLAQDGKESRKSLNGSSSSLRTSPLMSRTDLDKCDFIIPKTQILQKQISIHHKDTASLGALDVTQYLSNEEAQELKEGGLKLGEVKFCLAYDEVEEKLKIILKSVDVCLKPSASVLGSNWVCDTITQVDILSDKKKPIELTLGTTSLLDIKKNDVTEKTLRLSIYDSRRKHSKIPIGHALLPLREVSNIDRLNIHSKKITSYSQPAGFNKGNLVVSLSWISTAKRLEIKVGQASNLKSPHGVDGKDHFVKITVFISGNKHKSYKTPLVKATPELKFREKFTVPLTSSQLKETSLVFQLYMKHTSKKMIITKTLTGKTVIGPYMKHADRSLSQWEKLFTNPVEELMETHTLFL